jgi:hypothetical protein
MEHNILKLRDSLNEKEARMFEALASPDGINPTNINTHIRSIRTMLDEWVEFGDEVDKRISDLIEVIGIDNLIEDLLLKKIKSYVVERPPVKLEDVWTNASDRIEENVIDIKQTQESAYLLLMDSIGIESRRWREIQS